MLGERIRSRMQELGISQADVARRSGLSTGHVSDLVNGKRGERISAPTVARLSSALRVRPSFFFRDDSHMRAPRKSRLSVNAERR